MRRRKNNVMSDCETGDQSIEDRSPIKTQKERERERKKSKINIVVNDPYDFLTSRLKRNETKKWEKSVEATLFFFFLVDICRRKKRKKRLRGSSFIPRRWGGDYTPLT